MENTTPSTLGRGGRDASGRFAPGNKLGKGNPLAGRAAKIRAVLLEKLTPAAAGRIANKLIRLAEGGDLAAIRELLDRTIGKAAQFDILERLEKLETIIEEKNGYKATD